MERRFIFEDKISSHAERAFSYMKKKRIVVKVGTSTLTYSNGKMNLRNIEQLCKVLSDLHNSGIDIILVSSGAIGVGMGKLELSTRPEGVPEKQALAAIGQCELMFVYDKFFSEYNNTVAQVLITRDVVDNPHLKQNAANTLDSLLTMGIIPIVNENDTVSTDELEGSNIGDNDLLSAIVTELIDAEMLVLLTDIDGLYDKDPRKFEDAVLIKEVNEITDEIRSMAGGTGSNRGTGGMTTKLYAAGLAMKKGIPCYVTNGNNPKSLYKILEGRHQGTVFRTV